MTIHNELPSRIRDICARVAHEALPELREYRSDLRGAEHPWAVTVHAVGDHQIVQADIVNIVRQPSIFVEFRDGWTEDDLRIALEAAWLASSTEMSDYSVDGP